MKKVRIGILGCANIVDRYVANAIKQTKNGELVAIASRDIKKAKEFSEKYNCDYEDSYEKLIERKDIDAIYIPLPVGLHKEWTIKAANSKKHVICEKSLAESYSSVKKMVEVCKKNKVVLFENFMCNYHPQHEKVLSLIKNNRIGTPFLFKGMYGFPPFDKNNIRYKKALGGGALNDAGCYLVFMSRKLFEAEPLSVNAKFIFEDGYDVDIKGTAQLEFPDNKVAQIAFGFNSAYMNNYSLWANEGMIKVNRAYSIPPEMVPEIELITKTAKEKVDAPAANQFIGIFEDFFSKILTKTTPNYSGILNQAKVMEAIRISATKNKKIDLKKIL